MKTLSSEKNSGRLLQQVDLFFILNLMFKRKSTKIIKEHILRSNKRNPLSVLVSIKFIFETSWLQLHFSWSIFLFDQLFLLYLFVTSEFTISKFNCISISSKNLTGTLHYPKEICMKSMHEHKKKN